MLQLTKKHNKIQASYNLGSTVVEREESRIVHFRKHALNFADLRGYGYELFAKCFLANQKSPYFQDGGPKFKMAAKI